MNRLDHNNYVLTLTAITALKKAHEKCSDRTAVESILAAFNAINLFAHNFGIYDTLHNLPENDTDSCFY